MNFLFSFPPRLSVVQSLWTAFILFPRMVNDFFRDDGPFQKRAKYGMVATQAELFMFTPSPLPTLFCMKVECSIFLKYFLTIDLRTHQRLNRSKTIPNFSFLESFQKVLALVEQLKELRVPILIFEDLLTLVI